MNKFNLNDLETITAITTIYHDDIINHVLSESEEVLQSDVAERVSALYTAYTTCKEDNSLLDLINNKAIKLVNVM